MDDSRSTSLTPLVPASLRKPVRNVRRLSLQRAVFMRIAYLINQYPSVSHSFIRREILALERQGHEVLRISVRGWEDALQDEADSTERTRTGYVLRGGAMPLLLAMLRVLVSRP